MRQLSKWPSMSTPTCDFAILSSMRVILTICVEPRPNREKQFRSTETARPVRDTTELRVADPPVTSTPRKKWRQVANYVPSPPDPSYDLPDGGRIPAREGKMVGTKCALCPGPCYCREYLTAWEWQNKVAATLSNSTKSCSPAVARNASPGSVLCNIRAF